MLQHVEIVFVVVVVVVVVVFAQVSNVSLFKHLHREGKLGTSQSSFSSALGLKMKQNKKMKIKIDGAKKKFLQNVGDAFSGGRLNDPSCVPTSFRELSSTNVSH